MINWIPVDEFDIPEDEFLLVSVRCIWTHKNGTTVMYDNLDVAKYNDNHWYNKYFNDIEYDNENGTAQVTAWCYVDPYEVENT